MMSLRAWRLERVLGTAELAKRAGVSKVTIIGIEHGRVRPKLRTIRRLSEALGVDPKQVEEFGVVLDTAQAGRRALDGEGNANE